MSKTPAERYSETPIPPQQIDLSKYVTKAEHELQMLKKDQEIDSLKERLRLAEVKINQTQDAIKSIHEKLATLSAPPTLSKEDNPTESEKKSQEKEEGRIAGMEVMELTTQGESTF